MSRRIEITVPTTWAEPVRTCLYKNCGLNSKSGKPYMNTEMTGVENTMFFVTVPGASVSQILTELRKTGIGVACGRIVITSVDFLKPDLSKPLDKILEFEREEKAARERAKREKKPKPLKGYQHFIKARKTTEEMFVEISNGATMTINTWMNLIGACIMAAGGLTTNVTVFIVAAMLVSPIMGPILGMTFGYRVADWPLFKTGFVNEFKMAVTAYLVGVMFGVVLGRVGDTYNWPNSAMMPEGGTFNLFISVIVSSAAGTVLGVSLTSTFGNALVGTAISAGLLPPIINSGMLMAYSQLYAKPEDRAPFYATGVYNIFFYITHVFSIIIVANFVFWLKDIDPRFKEGDDCNFNDIPSLVEHRKKLQAMGYSDKDIAALEKEKAKYFYNNIRDDVKDHFFNFTSTAANITNTITGGLVDLRDVKYLTKNPKPTDRNIVSVNEVNNNFNDETPGSSGKKGGVGGGGDIELGARAKKGSGRKPSISSSSSSSTNTNTNTAAAVPSSSSSSAYSVLPSIGDEAGDLVTNPVHDEDPEALSA